MTQDPVYGKSPSLLFRLPRGRRISPQGIINLRAALELAFKTGQAMVLDDGMEVYQLIGGRWQPLTLATDPDTTGPCIGALVPSNGVWQLITPSPARTDESQ